MTFKLDFEVGLTILTSVCLKHTEKDWLRQITSKDSVAYLPTILLRWHHIKRVQARHSSTISLWVIWGWGGESANLVRTEGNIASKL